MESITTTERIDLPQETVNQINEVGPKVVFDRQRNMARIAARNNVSSVAETYKNRAKLIAQIYSVGDA